MRAIKNLRSFEGHTGTLQRLNKFGMMVDCFVKALYTILKLPEFAQIHFDRVTLRNR